jgi:hypothetical protein
VVSPGLAEQEGETAVFDLDGVVWDAQAFLDGLRVRPT